MPHYLKPPTNALRSELRALVSGVKAPEAGLSDFARLRRSNPSPGAGTNPARGLVPPFYGVPAGVKVVPSASTLTLLATPGSGF